MSVLDAADPESSKTVSRQRHPHPGESIPTVAWPTLAVAVGALIVFVVAAIAAIGRYAPLWITIPLNSTAVYWMFTVAHDALHGSVSSARWVNSVVGRFAWFFVVPMSSLSSFAYAHIQHHRYTNDADKDPDMFATHGPTWQLPFRWALTDFFYSAWSCRQFRGRLRRSWRGPVAELAEGALVSSLSVAGICAAVLTNNFWTLTVVLLIPQRIAMVFIGWWFDWLPHHALEHAPRGNPYRATRIRVGMEWLLTPVMMTFNYHLVHHLHPWLPFYRSLQVWWRNEDAYLAHDAAIATVFGRELTPDEFRAWKQASRWRRKSRARPLAYP
jgi:fatty acid desaturase